MSLPPCFFETESAAGIMEAFPLDSNFTNTYSGDNLGISKSKISTHFVDVRTAALVFVIMN